MTTLLPLVIHPKYPKSTWRLAEATQAGQERDRNYSAAKLDGFVAIRINKINQIKDWRVMYRMNYISQQLDRMSRLSNLCSLRG